VIEQLVRSGQARFEFRHYPAHSGSGFAALAMECAADQSGNAFWQFHDEYMSNSALRALRTAHSRAVDYAEEIGLDIERFEQCLDDETHLDRINDDFSAARRAGVRLTPTVFVNERNAGTLLVSITSAVERATP